MTEIAYDADHVKHSVGGKGGHIFRRGIHVGMCIVPWLYYEFADTWSSYLDLNRIQFAAGIGIAFISIEFVRLYFGITIVGQREYEAKQFSALAWGGLSIALVFVTLDSMTKPVGVHDGWLTIPLILSLTFGDPVMGEVRRYGMAPRAVFLVGSSVVFVTWLACWHFFSTPLFMAFIMGPLTTAAEWPKLKWIDDNATMVLIPLAAVLFISPFL